MKYAITENGRVVVLDHDTSTSLSSFANVGAATRPLIKWPTFEERNIFFCISRQPLPLERELGLLFGLYVGDGWVDRNVQCPKIHIANIDDNIIDRYRLLVNRFLRLTDLTGYATGAREHNYYPEYASIHGKFSMGIPSDIRHALIDCFGHGAHNKHLPIDLLSSPAEFRWGLLSGLIDTDGCITCRDAVFEGRTKQNKYVQYATQSWQLARDVQLLCMSLGINASISPFYRKGRYEFTLVLSSIDAYNYRHKLSCISGKHKVLDTFTFGAQVNPKDILPFDDELHGLLLSHNGYSHGGGSFYVARRRGYMQRDTFFKYASPEAVATMSGKYGTDNRWEQVLSIAYLPDGHTDIDLINKVCEVKREVKRVA